MVGLMSTIRIWHTAFRQAVRAWLLGDLTVQLQAARVELRQTRDMMQLAMQAQESVLSGIEAVHKLLEPQVARQRLPQPPPVADWDAVQRQNLQQFEENNDGKPFRR